MSDDNSNDVVMVESNGEDSKSSKEIETRPLMQLFQRLVSSDTKQNTILTNAQIISILHKEFDIDISTLHDLEVDIYLNIVKKFLKDWPLWDEFDQGVNSLRKQKAFKSIKRILESKYGNLISYLKAQLDAARPLTQETIKKLLDENSKKMEEINTSDIVLEIYSTRRQLNELIYRRPNPNMEHNVFNVLEYEPTAISLKHLPLEAILNWWGVQVTVELKAISFTRSTMHQLKHTLVNSKNGPRYVKKALNQKLQIKEYKRMPMDIKKEKIYAIFDNILKQILTNYTMYSMLESLFKVMKSDLEAVEGDVPVPSTFRQCSSKYLYYRKLAKEPKDVPCQAGNQYDLYIEETLTPMHLFHIGKVGDSKVNLPPNLTWLTIECGECKSKFNGVDFCTVMKEHFNVHHSNEPDWTCSNCEKTFPMISLAEHKWAHTCESH